MRFWNEDGGFGDPSRSFIYTTFLAVRALHLGENYLFNEFNNKDIKWLDKIRDKISEWILSCQNSDGGFGPRPGEPSNIQATFYALRSLFMLDKKIEKEENLIKWLKSNQNQDGGFSMNGLSSDISFTFYAVGSLIIISS